VRACAQHRDRPTGGPTRLRTVVVTAALAELFRLLGLSAGTVEQEGEVIEHHLTPETLRAFSRLVRFWRTHPKQFQAFLRQRES